MEKLISLDDAVKASRHQAQEWFNFVNPTLTSLLSLINFDRRYVKAEGIYVWDENGDRFFDFLGGYGAVSLGHNHPRILEALKKVEELPNILQATVNPLAGALAKNLATITPGDLEISFFCNSGAEAVEGALKLARAATGKKKIIYTENSFHGKTLGALSVTGREKYQQPFEPLIPGCISVLYGDLDALERNLKAQDIAAFIVEPIQGEGGMILPPVGFLKGAEELCRKCGALLIVDEVQTGLGRTGKMFACEHEGVQPDIMTLAKSLGGGFIPLGACITTRRIWSAAYGSINKFLLHTTTFGNNTRAAAAGIATLETLLDEQLIEAAREKGAYFLSRLKELEPRYQVIKEVRGKGLMIGIEFNEPAKGWLDKVSLGLVNKLSTEYFAQMVASELLNKYQIITAYTLNNPNVIRLMPPFVVKKEEIDYVIESLEKVCQEGFSKAILAGGLRAGKSLSEGSEQKRHLSESLYYQLNNPLEGINLPNILTIFRLLLIPVFVYFMLGPRSHFGLAAATLAVAGATDWLDGFAARRLKKITEFGIFFDPFVDRLLVFAVLITGYFKGLLPLWAVVLILGRDAFMILGYQYLRAKKKRLSLTFLGKGATALIAISLVLMLLNISAGKWLFYLSLGLSLISGLDYFQKGFKKLSQEG